MPSFDAGAAFPMVQVLHDAFGVEQGS